MATEDLFEFSAKMDVEVEKSSLDKAKGILDAFYAKYHDRKMKVDTSDMVKAFRGGITEIRKLYDQGMNQMAKDGFAWWDTEDDLENSFSIARNKMNDFFDELKVSFSDGSVVSGLGNILEKSLENVSIVAVDLGERINYLQSEILSTMNALKSLGAVKVDRFGISGFDNDDITSDQLKNRIGLLKDIFEYQQELEEFNGFKFSNENAPSGMQTVGLQNHIRLLKFNLKELETYNLRTTAQLKKRNELISATQNEYQWSEYDHDNAKENINDDDIYEYSLERLNDFIEARRSAIAELRQHEEELFSVDGISQYVQNAEAEIARFENAKLELQNLKNGKPVDADAGLTGDLSEVVSALGKIETAIQSVVEAFKPLTDALANEDSAISAMVKSNIADLTALNTKIEETFANIKTLSEKDFTITNVFNEKATAKAKSANVLDLNKKRAMELLNVFSQLQSQMQEYKNSSKIASTEMFRAGQVFGTEAFEKQAGLMAFDANSFSERINNAIPQSIGFVIKDITDYINDIVKWAEELNKSYSGKIKIPSLKKADDLAKRVEQAKNGSNINPLQANTSELKAAAANKDAVSGVDELATKINDLSSKLSVELAQMRAKIEETFNFATLDPQLFDVTSITQSIYQQFVELQNNVAALKFTVEAIPTVSDAGASVTADAIGDEIDKVKEVKPAFEDAAKAKDKFTDSNKRAADSAEKTTPHIEAETAAAESAYQAFAKFSFSEQGGTSESKFRTFAENIAKNKNLKVKSASLTKGKLGGIIGGNIAFIDPDTLQEIRERYSVRPKEDDTDALELYRASYTLIENTAKAEQKAANEAARRSKAIADSNKWLIEQEDLLTKQENKYKASSGAIKPLEGSRGLIKTNVAPGIDATLDGLAESIRSRINDAKGGIITQELKNEIIKDLNALANEIQVQQARTYQSTDLRANSIETSRDIYRNEIAALEADAKKAGVFDQMSSTISTLFSDVETFTEDTFVSFVESVKKANSQFKAEKAKFAQKKQEEKSVAEDTSKNQKIYDDAIKAQEKLYKLKKQMVGLDPESSKGQEKIREITDAQNEYNEVLSVTNRRLLTIGQLQDLDNLGSQLNKELGIKQQEYRSGVSVEQEAKDLKYVLSLYKQYTNSAKDLKKMQSDPTNASHYANMGATIQDIRDSKAELLALGIDVNNIANSELLTENQKLALLEEQIKYKRQIRDIENKAQDRTETKQNKQAQNYGKTIFNREQRYNGQISGRLYALGDTELSQQFLQTLNDYKDAYAELETLRQKFENDPNAAGNDALTSKFQASALGVEKLRKELLQTFREYDKFSNIPQESILGEDIFDPATMSDAKTAMMQLADAATDGKFQLEGFNSTGTEMYGVINKGNGTLEEVTVRLNSATNEMKAFTNGTQQVTTSWGKLGSELKKGVTQLVGRYLGFNELWQAVKQGVKYVKEIDLAMTELKKVTDETDGAYRKFLQNASKTAAVIGSTVSDFTDAASAFARLGYDLNESAKMAETAIVYKNVADGLDSVEESTESIISTMMAYGIAADDTMGIIDRFNAVGKLLPKLYSNIWLSR